MDKQLTPLMKAARKGAVNEVRSLLQEPIDVNEQDAHGLTALFHGVYSHNAEVVCTLLKAGASVRIHAVRGLTVLMYAVLYGDAGCLSVLCESAHPPSASPSSSRSERMWAFSASSLTFCRSMSMVSSMFFPACGTVL